MAKKILSIALALIMALSVFAVAASAATIEATAESFVNGFKTAADGDVVVLTEDVTLEALCTTKAAITLDLNGHEITSTTSYALVCDGDNGDLTIIDSVGGGAINGSCAVQIQNRAKGTIEAGTFNGTVKCVGDTFKTASYLTIEGGTFNGATALNSVREGRIIVNDAVVNGDVFLQNQGNVEVNGGTFTSPSYCFVTNGTDSSNNTIVINDGTFTATNATGAAIYFPTKNSITINGGTFTGSAAIYQKSGTTIINGGEFYATGAQAAYRYYGNGFYTTGDAIIADSCGYKGGAPIVRIYGGEFYSENGASVKGYTYGNNSDPVIAIYDGIFEDDAAETYPGYAVYNLTTATGYETFAAAAQAASEGDTIGLFEDVVVGAYTAVTDVTIDLFGNDITSEGNAPLDAFGTITVKDSFGGGKIAGAQRGIWVNTGATLTVDAAEVDGVVVDGGALTLKNAYIDGYVVTTDVASSVSVTGTTTTVTDQIAVNGGTLSINNGTFAKVYVYNGATATIKNGTYNHISVYDNAVATINNGTFGTGYFATGGSATVKKGTFNGQINISDGGALTIDGGTFNNTIVPVGGWPVNGDADATAAKAEYVSTLVVNNGTFTTTGMCISGNGTDVGTADITINGGKFVAYGADSAAIYQPQSGDLTINGGSFYGADALYLKSGTTVINDGTFKGRGAKADYEYYGSGFNSTGDTIVVDSCGYPGGEPSLTINGGSFYSENNEIIGYYVYGDNNLESTGFIVDGYFAKEVPSIYYADPTTFTLFYVNGGKATVDGTTVTILADQGSEKIEVLKKATSGETVTFDDVTGGATISKDDQLFARTNGTATATIGSDTYNINIVFQSFDVAELLVVSGATMTVSGSTITLTPDGEQVNVSPRTTADTYIEVGAVTGGAKVSRAGTVYAKEYGTAVVTVPNAGTYTVVFNYEIPEVPEVALVDNLRTTNATATVSGTTITLTPVDTAKSVSMVCKLWDGTAVTFSNLSKFGKISSNGSFYSDKYATATATIGGTEYTVVLNYVQVALVDNLRTTNATVAVDGTTITLTPADTTKSASIAAKLADGTAVTVKNAGTAKVSKYGSVYASEDATATVTIDAVDYTVVFDFPQVVAPGVLDLLKITGASDIDVDDEFITIIADAAQVNIYSTLTNGEKATFSDLDGAKVSKAGTLYAKGDATATVTVGGVDYEVMIMF